MDGAQSDLVTEIIAACSVLTREGLVKAFGHVSARLPHELGRFLITPRKALALVEPKDLVTVDLITTFELGRRVAAVLGAAEAVLLRGNGLAVVGHSVAEASVKAVFLEETAELQVCPRALGEPKVLTSDEVARRRETDRLHEPIRAWEFYRAMAGRRDPGDEH